MTAAVMAEELGITPSRPVDSIWKTVARLVKLALADPDRGWRAILLSCSVFVLLLGEVAAAGRYSVVQKNLITALQAKDKALFHRGLRNVGRIILCISPIIALREYAAGVLGMNCRTSLTAYFARKYLMPQKPKSDSQAGTDQQAAPCPYYALTLTGEIDNPDQRICQDVGHLVTSGVSFAQDVVRTSLSILTFAPVLYSISPAACIGGIAYAVTGTVVSARSFGRLLGVYQLRSLQREAHLRYTLIRVREHAESIAFFEGGAAEFSKFHGGFRNLLEALYQSVLVATGYSMLNRTFHWATFAVIPMLVGPAYLDGRVEFGVISQATMAFNIILEEHCPFGLLRRFQRVQAPEIRRDAGGHVRSCCGREDKALTLAMHRLESLSDLRVRLQRLAQLDDALSLPPVSPTTGAMAGTIPTDGVLLRFEAVTLRTPQHKDVRPKVLFEDLSFEVLEGQSLLISGASGIGKSSLLRAAAGLWGVAGSIQLQRSEVFFMPQKPYMFLGSLRDQLLYPQVDTSSASSTRLEEVLRAVNLEELIHVGLEEVKDWANILSLGQQQRINFARVLLQPSIRFALMDECTSACDPENELLLYQLLQQHLRGYVSVGHRPSLQQFHTHALWLRRSTPTTTTEIDFLIMQEFQEKMIDKFIDCIDKLNYGILWPEPRLS
ncbi:unnamed protein product [Durusdinium trenchii]|uniref:Uncharacterized protein n=1 Tax=Durusdinium trenchii TaxID=1381693 RepID=A0ABP0Q778_9DINO